MPSLTGPSLPFLFLLLPSLPPALPLSSLKFQAHWTASPGVSSSPVFLPLLEVLILLFFFHQTPTHTVKPKPHDSSSLWYHPRFFPSLMSHIFLLGMVRYRFLNPSLARGCTRAGGWISASPLPQGPEWGLFQSRWSGRVSERLIFLWFTFTY